MERITVGERRARLVRRHLLAPAARSDDPVEVARSLVALHSTDAATVFLSTWTRTRDFAAADLERALYDDGALVRMLGMRRTLWVGHCCTAAISSTSARRRRLYCDCSGRCGTSPGGSAPPSRGTGGRSRSPLPPGRRRGRRAPHRSPSPGGRGEQGRVLVGEDIRCNHKGFQIGRHLELLSRGTRLEALLRARAAGPCSEPAVSHQASSWIE